MSLPSKLPTSRPTPEQIAEAKELLRIALEADTLAREAMEKAEAAFKAIAMPLPLFEQIDRGNDA